MSSLEGSGPDCVVNQRGRKRMLELVVAFHGLEAYPPTRTKLILRITSLSAHSLALAKALALASGLVLALAAALALVLALVLVLVQGVATGLVLGWDLDLSAFHRTRACRVLVLFLC